MANSSLGDSLKEASRELRSKFLERIAAEIHRAAVSSKNGKVPWGYSSKILIETKLQEPWVTKNMIDYTYKKYCEKKCLNEDATPPSDNNHPNSCGTLSNTPQKPVGRP